MMIILRSSNINRHINTTTTTSRNQYYCPHKQSLKLVINVLQEREESVLTVQNNTARNYYHLVHLVACCNMSQMCLFHSFHISTTFTFSFTKDVVHLSLRLLFISSQAVIDLSENYITGFHKNN